MNKTFSKIHKMLIDRIDPAKILKSIDWHGTPRGMLTDEEVRWARNEYKKPGSTYKSIGLELGRDKSAICNMINYDTYRDVK